MAKQLKEIEIPFGAKDSELYGWEYTIPDGMEATIVDNKIVVKKKESEDERIRKEMIFYFKEEIPQCSIQEHTDKMREFVAWLEKQGKNNMGISEATKKKLEDKLHKALEKETAESFNAFLDEQGEQKDILEDAILDSNKDGLIADTIRYKKEKQGEQKSDETEKGRNGNDREIPNSTWSEEEERIIDRLCEILYDCHSYGKCSLKLNEYSNLYDWLKSLRPQNTWKPSDEQMKLLREVQQALLGKDCHNRFVNFMYELKRLREE